MTRILLAVTLCALAVSSGRSAAREAAPEASRSPAPDPVRAALAKGEYPWYDATHDRLKPVDLAPKKGSSWLQSIGDWIDRLTRRVGDFFARIGRALHLPAVGSLPNLMPVILTVVGVILLGILMRILWSSRGNSLGDEVSPERVIGRSGRIAMLPELAGAVPVDPLAEAEARRRRGDYSGAIVYLFAHQLQELDRLGMIRLAPGGTGRKYVRSLADTRLREPLSETLGLFEQAYYGHKRLSASIVDPVWARSQTFLSHLASLERQAR